jgi:hypothetical protein
MNYCPHCGHRLPTEESNVGYGSDAAKTARELSGDGQGMFPRLETRVMSSLGMELVDTVNVLRDLGVPEEYIQTAVISRSSS